MYYPHKNGCYTSFVLVVLIILGIVCWFVRYMYKRRQNRERQMSESRHTLHWVETNIFQGYEYWILNLNKCFGLMDKDMPKDSRNVYIL